MVARSLQVIRDASVCEDAAALKDPKIHTAQQVLAARDKRCPLFDACNMGVLLGPDKHNCIPRMAQDVARYAVEAVRPIDAELKDFRSAPIWSKEGFIDPYKNHDKDSPDFATSNKDEVVKRVGEWARTIVNGDPQQVRDERCICPVLKPTPGGCPVHGG